MTLSQSENGEITSSSVTSLRREGRSDEVKGRKLEGALEMNVGEKDEERMERQRWWMTKERWMRR